MLLLPPHDLPVLQGQVAQPKLSMNSLTHVWAWPLPHLDMSSWLPYESMLRGLLASHPFNIKDVMKSGIPLRLTKSSIKVRRSSCSKGGNAGGLGSGKAAWAK